MSVPARKKSRSSVRRRRSHDALKPQNVGVCQACSAPVMPHRACKSCGAYKGKQTLDVSRDAARAVKQAARSAEAHDHSHAEEGHDHDHSAEETTTESKEKAS